MDRLPLVSPIVIEDQVSPDAKEPGRKLSFLRIEAGAAAEGPFKGRSGEIFGQLLISNPAANVAIEPGVVSIKKGRKIQTCHPRPRASADLSLSTSCSPQ